MASEAYALWRDLAVKRSNPYGDHSGCLLAGRMAIEATRWEDGLVILAAIRERMDEKSSPRWIPEWARDIGARRREDARNVQKARERDEAETMDPEIARIAARIPRSWPLSFSERASLAVAEAHRARGRTDCRCDDCASARSLAERGVA